ncbi:MAG: hypothetical protein QMD09_03590 [Desulfatibacillaceae bacterium]|nr:hypothetical protein [Desulfatibacillaceae bacterium]
MPQVHERITIRARPSHLDRVVNSFEQFYPSIFQGRIRFSWIGGAPFYPGSVCETLLAEDGCFVKRRYLVESYDARKSLLLKQIYPASLVPRRILFTVTRQDGNFVLGATAFAGPVNAMRKGLERFWMQLGEKEEQDLKQKLVEVLVAIKEGVEEAAQRPVVCALPTF